MIKTIIKSIREYKRESILTPTFVAIESLVEALIPFVMAYLIDRGINQGDLDIIFISGIILIVCAIVTLFTGILSGKYAADASSGIAKNLRQDMYHQVQKYSFYNIDNFSSSSIVTRLTTDVANVQNAYQAIIRTAVRAPSMVIFSLVMAFIINREIGFIFLAIVPILSIGLILIAKMAHRYFQKVFNIYDELNNRVQENVRGIRVVKSYVREKDEINKFQTVSKKIYDYFSKAEKIVAFNQPLMQTCMYLSIVIISWLCAHYIVSGTMSEGELASLLVYAMTILSSLMMTSMVYVMCIIAIPSAERCAQIINEVPDIKNPSNSIKEVKNGSIEFKGVSFSYIRDRDRLSLDDININIKAGEVIGIIGGTGSSKSTLVNLIPRLYDVTMGELLVGGENVKNYDLNTLRDNVSMVLQKNVLFSGTIEDNMRWGRKDATIEEIEHACELACASEFINKMPNKYETYIEQGGTNVSGGQKQRLCIARALLKNPKILILDDSTSACDTATDAQIRKNLKEYAPKLTKIIIAQRISSVEDADKVIVLDDGEVNAYDTPQNLLKNNKIYQEVYYSQIDKESGDE